MAIERADATDASRSPISQSKRHMATFLRSVHVHTAPALLIDTKIPHLMNSVPKGRPIVANSSTDNRPALIERYFQLQCAFIVNLIRIQSILNSCYYKYPLHHCRAPLLCQFLLFISSCTIAIYMKFPELAPPLGRDPIGRR